MVAVARMWTQRSSNGLRLAGSVAGREEAGVRVFLIGDAAACAERGQEAPNGDSNLEQMLRAVTRWRGRIGVCVSCLDAGGIADSEIVEGVHRSSMDQLTDWALWADPVLVL